MTTRIFHPLLELLLLLAAFPLLTNAYSFELTSKPKQCQDLSLKITGTGGNPPYQLVLVPAGPSPLPGGVEPRIVTVKDFPNNNDTLTFKLAYPGNSKFVAVVCTILSS
jgi:SWI/SNF related-matrix-associated actin-dependent regulator of chromatin subfamily C